MEGESEEAVRRRIVAEYQNEGLWSSTSSGKDNEQGGGGGADEGDDDDPLDAFMAGIEVKCVCVHACASLFLVQGRHLYSMYTESDQEAER